MINTVTRELFDLMPVAFFETHAKPMAKLTQSFALNAWEHEDKYFLRAELVGCSKEDVQIQVQDHTLWIEAKQKPFLPEQARVLIQETKVGVLARRIVLPKDADTQNIQAQMIDGVLVLNIGKMAPKRTNIQID